MLRFRRTDLPQSSVEIYNDVKARPLFKSWKTISKWLYRFLLMACVLFFFEHKLPTTVSSSPISSTIKDDHGSDRIKHSNELADDINTSVQKVIKTINTSKDGDGCYHVFLDVGSNVGVHGRFLFEPKKYLNAAVAHGVFDKHFGTPGARNNKDICIFSFEPNPSHVERHLQLQRAYDKLGWRYHHIHAGVGDEAGNLTLYRQDKGENNEWGFGMYPRKGTENVPVNVTIIRLSTWLTEHIEDRVIPKKLSKNEEVSGPKVLMKFDVEGMEFDLFPDLFTTGSLCRNVDYAFGEIHPFKWDGGSRRKINQLQKTLREWNASDDCKTKRIDQIDDESYKIDPQPLPGAE